MPQKDLQVFRRFIENPSSNLDEVQMNLCILLYLHYDELEKTSFRSGVRQRAISKLIVDNMGKKLSLPDKANNNRAEGSISRLTKISVKSFRGFQEGQTFKFGKRFTFMYGRNGTGKSSLVDGIELALLNNIQEAKYKRIALDQYIKNIYTTRGLRPHLFGLDESNKEVEVISNPELYDFSIIERNRIENFARISAETAAVQQQRLAALIGLESWSTFVSNFSKDIDSSLQLSNEMENEISNETANLKSLQEQLETSVKSVKDSKKAQSELLSKFEQSAADKLSDYLETEKIKVSKNIKKMGEDPSIIHDLLTPIRNNQAAYLQIQLEYHRHLSELESYKDNLSLVDLANAILRQQSAHQNNCPACLSQIRDAQGNLLVPTDPYDSAKNIQNEFAKATEVERKAQQEREKLTNQARRIDGFLQAAESSLQTQPVAGKEAITRLHVAIENLFNNKKLISETDWITEDEFDCIQSAIDQHNEEHERKRKAKAALVTRLNEIIKAAGTYETAKKTIRTAASIQHEIKDKIEGSNRMLIRLKAKAATARQANAPLIAYREGYRQIVEKLKTYTASLPSLELADLNGSTLRIYNLINKNDFVGEQLLDLRLPVSSNQSIRVQFNVPNAPVVDALDVLSEGHIRTLGLAILLAKALKTKQPFIIFDDVVNAIDDDPREAIAEIVTDVNGEFSHVQWIVTTHGQEFAKQLISHTARSMQNDIKEITFKARELGSDIVSIDKTQNYLALAQQRLDDEDIRGCLAESRREVEVLMTKLWRLYKKRFSSRGISIIVDPTNPIPETRNVMDVLRSAFKKQLKGNENESRAMANILAKLDILLDNRGISWFLVNKGTHEEENSEQHDVVETRYILQNLLYPLDEELTNIVRVTGSALVRSEVN